MCHRVSWSWEIRREFCVTSRRKSCSNYAASGTACARLAARDAELVWPEAARCELHLDVVPAARGHLVAELVRRPRSDCLRSTEVLRAQVADVLRTRLPEEEIRGGFFRPLEREPEALALLEIQAVHVDLVVPEVDRRLHGNRCRRKLGGVRSGIVVRLEPVGRWDDTVESADRLGDVEPAPAAVRVAEERALLASVRRVHV